MPKSNKRALIFNKNGQYTITLPKSFIIDMEAEPGDLFKFKYPKPNTLVMTRVVRDAPHN